LLDYLTLICVGDQLKNTNCLCEISDII